MLIKSTFSYVFIAKAKIDDSQITIFYDSICTGAQQIREKAHQGLFIVNIKAVKTGTNSKCIERNEIRFIFRVSFLNVYQQPRLLTRQ